MLKSLMKQKFGGRSKGAAASAPSSKEEPSTGASTSSRSSGVASSTKPASSTVVRAAGNGREKPPLPVLSEENAQQIYADPPPSFREAPNSEKQQLFARKLHLCAYSFDFTDHSKHTKEKEIKRQTLLELVDYVNSGTGKFTEAVAEDIIFMLSNNLFRALPPTKSHDQDSIDPDEEEPALEPAWPHLQVRTSNACNICFRLFFYHCCALPIGPLKACASVFPRENLKENTGAIPLMKVLVE